MHPNGMNGKDSSDMQKITIENASQVENTELGPMKCNKNQKRDSLSKMMLNPVWWSY